MQHHALPQLLRASTLEEDDGFSSLEVSDLSNRALTPPPRPPSSPKIRNKVCKSASMKLKWFPAFRLGGSSHSTNNNTSNTKQPQPQRSIVKTASTASLVRRSSSRLNISSDVALNPAADDYGSSATPILLSVRKRSTSDSGYSGNSGEDYTSSSHCGDDSPVVPSAKPRNIHGLNFLRLFHKSSATLQLYHRLRRPCTSGVSQRVRAASDVNALPSSFFTTPFCHQTIVQTVKNFWRLDIFIF